MTRAEIDEEIERVEAKLNASIDRRGRVLDGANDRVMAIQARLEELRAMTADGEG